MPDVSPTSHDPRLRGVLLRQFACALERLGAVASPAQERGLEGTGLPFTHEVPRGLLVGESSLSDVPV